MPRKNHLDISYSRLQHNQECRSKNHLKEEHVKVPVEVMSGFKYILILCENKNINRQRTCNLVEKEISTSFKVEPSKTNN